MDGIEPERKKNTSTSLIRWIFGVLFLLACFGAIVEFHIIAGLIYLLAAIISIPPTAKQLENKINFQMSGTVRFVVVFALLIVAAAAMPSTKDSSQNNLIN